MKTSIAGARFSREAGQEIELPDSEARALIARGQARPVEAAVVPAPEMATHERQRRNHNPRARA